MVLGKYCIECGEFFPAAIGSFISCCNKPQCQARWEMIVNHIKISRNIDAKYFDLWDSDRPRIFNHKIQPNMVERVCRICAAPLLKKDGSYNAYRRQCEQHVNALLDYNWPIARDRTLFENQKRNQDKIVAWFVEKGRRPTGWEIQTFGCCDDCGAIGPCDVHHKIPVHTLTSVNVNLIWYPQNLKCLCKKCHHDQDHQLKRIVKVESQELWRFKRLDAFMSHISEIGPESIEAPRL